jgi:hypothetical protein
MNKAKKILAIVGAFVAGVLFIIYGGRELINSRKLADRGKATTGHVTDMYDWVSGRLRHHTYYLTVNFQPESGSAVSKKITVSEGTYESTGIGGTVKVFYLAEDPTICAAGEKVDMRYGNLLWGIGVLAIAVYLIKTFNHPSTLEEVAENIEKSFSRIQVPKYEYAPANAAEFTEVDQAFYVDARQRMEQQGYAMLADEENTTLRNAGMVRTFLRRMLNRDQTVTATLYHFKSKARPDKQYKILDLETSFSNGRFMLTTNAAKAGGFDYPPQIDAFFLPADAPLEAVMQAHDFRAKKFLTENPGAQAARVGSIEEVHRIGDEVQRIKADFRSQKGLSKAELERITGKSGEQIDEIAAILARRHEGRRAGLPNNMQAG